MKNIEIEKAILRNLYESYFQKESGSSMDQLCEDGGWDSNLFWKVADRLANDNLIRAETIGGFYKTTSAGVLSAEEQGFVPEELKKHNERARTLIMDILAKAYDVGGSFADEYFEDLAKKTGLDEYDVVQNAQVLEDFGHVESVGNGYKITHRGLDAVEKWRERSTVSAEYEQIAKMNPQARGRALQKWFAKIVQQHGWSQEEDVKTSHEEMDVIVYREREYYLVECKWEKDSIQADVIRELYGKLGNRVAVHGIVVSMSGFAKGAVKQAEEYAGQKVILLFGSGDINNMVTGQTDFDDLLNIKYKELMTHKKIVFA